MASAHDWIQTLELERHIEGGYFKRFFQADHRPKLITNHGERYSLTAIYYLLNKDQPIGRLHLNRSDIIHNFIDGDPIRYTLIHAETGELQQIIMGRDIQAGQTPTLCVPGGYWKASELLSGDQNEQQGFGLITEAVAPGFDFEDMTLAQRPHIINQFPQHAELLKRLIPADSH